MNDIMDDFKQYIQKLTDEGLSLEQVVGGEIVEDNPGADFTENEGGELTIMGCMSSIVDGMIKKDTKRVFNKDVFKEKSREIEYVGKMCGTTPRQTVLLACCIEKSSRPHFDKENLASFMEMTYIKLLSFEGDLRYLHDRRLILTQRDGDIHIPSHVIPALTENKPYNRPSLTGMDSPAILKELKRIMKEKIGGEMDESDMMEELDMIMDNNPQAKFVNVSTDYKVLGQDQVTYMERLIYYNLVYRYLYEDDDVVGWHDFEDVVDDDSDINRLRSYFKRGELELQKKGVIESTFEDGFADADYFHIKDEIKEQLFEEVGGLRQKRRRGGRLKLTPTKDIQSKEMYYNPTEAGQIDRLASLLADENYKATTKRLKESGLRTGFSCIFYGSPGTGKTETVYQLAKRTGRAIAPVNVSEIKSCWVGESEKLIKGVFDKYRAMVEESPIAPILLFNEADAIFGIRREAATDAVDKMENSIQNIILQEMEKLDGILIATTNLTQNLDKAFERRFLYKVKFSKPSLEAKGKIWKSLLTDLSEEQAMELASSYDFSGGQIENISRKKVVQSIIDGREPDYDDIRSYCSEELIDGKGHDGKRIGF